MSPGDADLCVLLTPRDIGGHEVALLGWLADAVQREGLRPLIFAPTPALVRACEDRGLAAWLWRRSGGGSARSLLSTLCAWPGRRPLLLAPGVLHAQAWLLAAALALQRQVWVYTPMTHSAVQMGYRAGRLRDLLLSPWLRRVASWIALDADQALVLRDRWRTRAPVHLLPNLARVAGQAPMPPPPAADGRLRVAFVGRFEPWQKGLDWLISLLRHDGRWDAAFHWRFQGRGPATPALLELASALGPQRVEVCDHAPLDDALAASDVLLLPSRYEGLPLVALEATARGWPVVASRSSGLATLLPASSLFDVGDGHGLAAALESLRTPAARAGAVAHARSRLNLPGLEQRYGNALRHLVLALQRGRTC